MTKTYKLPNGKEIKVTAKNKRVAKKFHNAEHYAYTIIVETSDGSYRTTFHDSIYNYSRGLSVRLKDFDGIVECIISDYSAYDYNTLLMDFLNEFGYEPDSKEGERAYYGCKETFDGLNAFLTREDLNEWNEMLYK
jgi:hypothetical protein